MYKITGGDGKQYGPISADQVRAWLAEGRLNADSLIQSDTDPQRKPLRTFTEFAALCSGNVPAAGAPAKTCGLAVASLVLGLVSLLCGVLAAIPGLICGCAGLGKINRSAGTLTGKGLAIAGICFSGFFMVVNIFVIAAIVIPTFTTAHDYGRAAGCMNNLKRLHVALLVYAEEHDGKLPDAANWCDAIQKQVPERLTFRCATSGGQYRFNRNLSGIALSRVAHAESTVLLFESNGGWTASGAAADLPAKPTHRGGCNVLFVDGHVERVATTRLRQLRWQSNE